MAPPKKPVPKGDVLVGGHLYTPAEIKALGPYWNLINPTNAGTGATDIYLPNSTILHDMGIPQATANQWGLKKLKLTTSTLAGTTASASYAIIESIHTLPKALQPYIFHRLGLGSPTLVAAGYKTLTEQMDAILPVLQAAGGHIGNVDLGTIIGRATVTTLKKVLATTTQALLSGDNAALIGATASAKYTAEANADSTLTNWGIDTPDMNGLVARLVASGVTNQNEILQNIRATPTYKTAFAGLAEYNAVPGHVHMTENEYRAYSQSVQGAAQQYGNVNLNQQQIGELLKGNVTAPEFQQRVQDIGVAIQNADPGTLALLKQWYPDINTAHLFAYYANPKNALPDMQRAVASAEFGDYAQRVGLGGLTEAQAGQLADMAKLAATQGNNPLGYGVTQVESSLLGAAKNVPLEQNLPGVAAPTVNTETLIGSQLPGFGPNNQQSDQLAIERAAQAKVAPFEKGGGYAEDAKGVVGLGSART